MNDNLVVTYLVLGAVAVLAWYAYSRTQVIPHHRPPPPRPTVDLTHVLDRLWSLPLRALLNSERERAIQVMRGSLADRPVIDVITLEKRVDGPHDYVYFRAAVGERRGATLHVVHGVLQSSTGRGDYTSLGYAELAAEDETDLQRMAWDGQGLANGESEALGSGYTWDAQV